MAEQETKGSRLLAIPHNSNGSKGLMFEPLDNSGKPITADYARLRSHFERLIEMMQIKGNSEVHRKFWPADEFAGFENADSVGTFSGRTFKKENFVRWAVVKGLDYQTKLGVNPYQLGFIGGTDNHNGLPSDVAEDDYIGSHGPADGTVEARREGEIDGWIKAKESSPGSIVRGLGDAEHACCDLGRDGCARNVRHVRHAHQGAVLRWRGPRRCVDERRANWSSRAIAMACRWAARSRQHPRRRRSRSGRPRIPTARTSIESRSSRAWSTRTASRIDKVIDVVWCGDRKPGKDGKLPPVGNTVDVTQGDVRQHDWQCRADGPWTDPDFDPSAPPLYYVRVLEIPTPRWTTYDAVRNKLPLLPDVPAMIQERAWSSPIWYTPSGT